MRKLTYCVTSEYDGKSLSFIFNNVLHLSGYLVRRNKHIPGSVTVNDQHADVRTVVSTGDRISVLLSDTERRSNVIPAKGPISIIYEDDDIIVLNKKAEDIVHPDHSHPDNTLGNYLMDYFICKNDPADFHPIQRLDNGTSGLIIFAKHSYAQSILSEAMHTDDFTRYYLAVCDGLLDNDSGIIEAPIARPDERSIKRCVDPSGQYAKTEYTVLKRLHSSTIVKLRLFTGRTHQIRVHMAHIGHPLSGDTLYGGSVMNCLSRPALHSYIAQFTHPVTKEHMTLKAPLPDDMLAVIRQENDLWT